MFKEHFICQNNLIVIVKIYYIW